MKAEGTGDCGKSGKARVRAVSARKERSENGEEEKGGGLTPAKRHGGLLRGRSAPVLMVMRPWSVGLVTHLTLSR